MKTKDILHILFLSILIFTSCEKVIDVDLKDAKPRVVVEAQITSNKGVNFVSLTKTSRFYSTDTTETIRGAIVKISNDNGNVFTLDEIRPGLYNSNILAAYENQKYKLSIISSEGSFEATSTTKSLVKIDSVNIELNEFIPGGGAENENKHYQITAYFNDNPDEVNFYRLRLVVNGEYMSGFHVVDDRVFNGKTIPYNFNGIVLEDNDKIWVELFDVDEANFQYFYTLARLQNNGGDITPGNPPSNIEGGAIGVFGASTFDSFFKVFEESEVN